MSSNQASASAPECVSGDFIHLSVTYFCPFSQTWLCSAFPTRTTCSLSSWLWAYCTTFVWTQIWTATSMFPQFKKAISCENMKCWAFNDRMTSFMLNHVDGYLCFSSGSPACLMPWARPGSLSLPISSVRAMYLAQEKGPSLHIQPTSPCRYSYRNTHQALIRSIRRITHMQQEGLFPESLISSENRGMTLPKKKKS